MKTRGILPVMYELIKSVYFMILVLLEKEYIKQYVTEVLKFRMAIYFSVTEFFRRLIGHKKVIVTSGIRLLIHDKTRSILLNIMFLHRWEDFS